MIKGNPVKSIKYFVDPVVDRKLPVLLPKGWLVFPSGLFIVADNTTEEVRGGGGGVTQYILEWGGAAWPLIS